MFNSDKEYYPQILSEEYQYAIKNKNKMNTINEGLELSESDDEFDKFDKYQHTYDDLH